MAKEVQNKSSVLPQIIAALAGNHYISSLFFVSLLTNCSETEVFSFSLF
jgi:hypothetical protein